MVKMEKINELIVDKENKVSELNEEINKRKKEIEELDSVLDFTDQNGKQHANRDKILPQYTDYDDANSLYVYKTIKKNFNFDYEKVIKDFLEKNKETKNDDYIIYNKIKEIFNYDFIYKMLSLKPIDQKKIVLEMLDEKEQEKAKELIGNCTFNIRRFLRKVDEKIIKNDPKIKIYVGDKNISYNSLNNDIETIFDEKITEGFKIVYQGTIYDYSI